MHEMEPTARFRCSTMSVGVLQEAISPPLKLFKIPPHAVCLFIVSLSTLLQRLLEVYPLLVVILWSLWSVYDGEFRKPV